MVGTEFGLDASAFGLMNSIMAIYALTAALHEYIRWYNTERISTKLKGLSPVQYRAQTLAA